MELIYLYIKDHPILSDCNLNFGGKFRFEYKVNRQELIITENPYYIKNFFLPPTDREKRAIITNITAVVGENGTGKTTLLDLLSTNLIPGYGGVHDPIILAFTDEHEKLKIYHDEIVPIKKNNANSFSATIIPLKRKKATHGDKATTSLSGNFVPPQIQDFEQTTFIFFSNIFDGRLEYEFRGARNISTNHLIRAEYKRNIDNKILNREQPFKEVSTYVFEEIERQIAFINGKHDMKLPFTLPDRLEVSIKNDLTNHDMAFSKGHPNPLREYGIEEFFIHLSEVYYNKIVNQKSPARKAKDYFMGNCVLNFLYELATNYLEVSKHFKIALDTKLINPRQSIRKISTLVLGHIDSLCKEQEVKSQQTMHRVDLKPLQNSIRSFSKFFKLLDEIVDEELVNFSSGTSFSIDIKSKPLIFQQFYLEYLNTYTLKPYLNFDWRNLSSGEKAFLNIFSRFYSLSNDREMAHGLNKHLIIMIDEGDLYLHPAWQKQFVCLLLDFLTKIYFKTKANIKRTLQIFFTTNSPIPVSDFPNSNVIFLEKQSDRIIVRDSLDDHKQTFAANIHSLLADSFFLKRGTIGDFAFSKINSIISLLQGDIKSIENSKDEIQKTILMIGEPVVKTKLIQMLNDRLSVNMIEYDKRLALLENEVKSLQGNR